MQLLKSIVATTHIDKHNERMTLEALEGMAEDVNNGDRPILTLDHDLTIPPFGKMLSAKVELRKDGEYELFTESEVFDATLWTVLPDGTEIFNQESQIDDRPFSARYERSDKSDYEISIDPVNFGSYELAKMFGREVKQTSGIDLELNFFGRKSVIPDSEIIIKLAEVIAAYLLTRKVVDKIADKVIDKVSDELAEDISKFYTLAKAIIASAAKYVHPKGRPITYVFVAAKRPSIEFVVRTTDTDLVLSSIMLDKLRAAMEKAEEIHKRLGATNIQFLLNEHEEWEFNYLLTKTGGVIGTKKAYSNRNRKFKLMSLSQPKPD